MFIVLSEDGVASRIDFPAGVTFELVELHESVDLLDPLPVPAVDRLLAPLQMRNGDGAGLADLPAVAPASSVTDPTPTLSSFSSVLQDLMAWLGVVSLRFHRCGALGQSAVGLPVVCLVVV